MSKKKPVVPNTTPHELPWLVTDAEEVELQEYLAFNVSWSDRNKSRVPQVVRSLLLALPVPPEVEE